MQMYAALSQSNAVLSPLLSLERLGSITHSDNRDGYAFTDTNEHNVEQWGSNSYTIRPG